MHFHRVHIEVTNICGLACSFCPPKLQPSKTMPLVFFEKVLKELKPLIIAWALGEFKTSLRVAIKIGLVTFRKEFYFSILCII